MPMYDSVNPCTQYQQPAKVKILKRQSDPKPVQVSQ